MAPSAQQGDQPAGPQFSRIVRFVPVSDNNSVLLGEPVEEDLDVGAALVDGKDVNVRVFTGHSVLDPGSLTERTESIGKLLSPLSREEVGTIRCIGLNYKQHAEEVKFPIPTEPTLFLKPSTALADPWPAPTIIPKFTLADDCADYEAELAVVIGKECKNVSEADAMDYVLGYTAANDVSSRKSQFSQTQWCFSKGFDGSCPLGPVLVSKAAVPDPSKLKLRGMKNGRVLQECGLDDLIFSVEKVVSFCSQGTTLPPGTVIITGTPAGVGVSRKPQEFLRDGDRFAVEIMPYIGTLMTEFVNET
ncbi:hypothetical protein H2201_002788 [Coniosporium apollinis]|uniref:Fumarylacetoacetase-like C-terminal domain-containing protein n=1 Tax=Coniosporium apollinis TaxID=61459 RepID=A0ABQ9P059_9PEZI|nr:hypothetical protein H2201_002788 [Coniosporium apollinis]